VDRLNAERAESSNLSDDSEPTVDLASSAGDRQERSWLGTQLEHPRLTSVGVKRINNVEAS
jgi:hypothetical protein